MTDVSEATALSVLLGRQPIVDRSGALVAYELLFRGGTATNAAVVSDDHAATELWQLASLNTPPCRQS